MEENLTVNFTNGVFNYRAGAIIIDSDEILMVKNSGSSFYYTVGGRVKLGEASRDVILREAYEETQLNLEIDRLAFIHENFFVSSENGQKYHEICFFFLMKPNNLLRKRIIFLNLTKTVHIFVNNEAATRSKGNSHNSLSEIVVTDMLVI